METEAVTQGSLHVLIMAKEPAERKRLAEKMGEVKPGAQVEGAGTLAEGLARLARETFDVVVLDMDLPDSQGLATLRRVREAAPGVAVVVTSVGEVVDEEAVLDAGAQDFLVPDLPPVALARVLRSAQTRQRLMRELMAAREWLAAVVDGAPMLVLGLSERSRIVVFNREAERLTGYRAEEVVGKEWIAFFVPQEWQAELYKVWEEVATQRSIDREYENPIVTRNGEVRWIHWRNSVLTEGGAFRMVISIGEDVTERRRMQEALRRETRLRELLLQISSQYINLPAGSFEESIIASLRDVASFVGADRAYIFEYDFGNRLTRNTYEWCGEGIEPQIDKLQAVPLDSIPEWVMAHQRGETIYIADVLALPPGNLREILEPQQIKSLLTVPLITGEECIGFIGFDWVRERHIATEVERGLLVTFSQVLTNMHLRRRIEGARAESERRFRSILEGIGLYAVIVDREGRVTFINDALLEATGWHRAAVVGEDYLGRLMPQDEPGQVAYRTALESGTLPARLRRRIAEIVTHEGTRRTVEWNSFLLRDLVGHPIGLALVGQDLTEVVEARREREAQVERLALINGLIQAMLSHDDLTGMLTTMLGRLTALLSADMGIVFTGPPHALQLTACVAGDAPDVCAALAALDPFRLEESGLNPYQNETLAQLPAAGGHPAQWLLRQVGMQSLVARPLGVSGMQLGVLVLARADARGFSDRELSLLGEIASQTAMAVRQGQLYTSLRASEERLREQTRALEGIMEVVPVGLLLLDRAGRVLLANTVARRSLAVLAHTTNGEVLTHLGDRPLAEFLMSPPVQGLWHEVTVAGRVFEVLARPLAQESDAERWVLALREVTQERQWQERLRRQERLAVVGQLAAGMAHDFNNSLAVIMLYTDMARRMPDAPPAFRERLQVVTREAGRAAELIRKILDFARRSPMESRPVDLAWVVRDLVEILRGTLPENIAVEFVAGEGDFSVVVDPTAVHQALLNLAVNARDAMPVGGTLRIELGRVGPETEVKCMTCEPVVGEEWVRVAVSDTGGGIAPEVLAHIFEPFFTTKETGKGTGLGLSQVYGIVHQLGGHITVDTEVGMGTTFTLYFPASATSVPLAEEETAEELMGHGETILVVEDNAPLRRALVEVLQQYGYRAVEAGDGQEALELLENLQEIVLVVSDLVMPGLGGDELLRALRERGYAAPVVILSGYPMGKEMERLAAEELAGWLIKPPSPERLVEVIARALRPERSSS